MFSQIRSQIQQILTKAVIVPDGTAIPSIVLDVPADKQFGEFSCNIAMQLSRTLKKNPLLIAGEIQKRLTESLETDPLRIFIERIEGKAPGFINFYLSPQGFHAVLGYVFDVQERYGQSEYGARIPFCLEFVSANPTGPLTVAHGRQAAVGDTLVNILKAVGFDAKKEYYVNDEGNQINILGRSIQARARQICGEDIVFPEDGYQGKYIEDMARIFIEKRGITQAKACEALDLAEYRQFGVEYLMDVIKSDLFDFGVHFDIWSYQSQVADLPSIARVVDDLKSKGFIYEHEGALWFKSTQWGDDKDRVVKKSNGDYTYLTPDIVYHKNKFERGFKRIVNILGPDHHGYIPRIKAAAGALGKSVDDLDIVIVQLATIFRDGKEVSMSTRRGEFITLREVIDDVGRDAGRFFFLMRQTSAHLEFDLDLAKKQSADNPVYYIQYAHARIYSIIRKAQDELKIMPTREELFLLDKKEEIELIRKIALYPDVLVACAKALDPFSLTRYLQELAGAFHKFYDSHRVLDAQDVALSGQRLALIEAARIVLGNGLGLCGLNAPEKM